jgi:hypothetical protein
MNKRFFLSLVVIAVCAITFAGCNKLNNEDNVSSASLQNSNGVVFDNVKWVLVDENHVGQYGNIGRLYVNANNQEQELFEITMMSKACPPAGIVFTGTYSSGNLNGVVWAKCEGAAKDCWWGRGSSGYMNAICRCVSSANPNNINP